MNEPETNKPNPPRYPFVVLGPSGPLKDDDGNIDGYRKKADAIAAKEIAESSADFGGEPLTVDRIPMADNIKIQGEE